jgi:ribonuclease I
MRNILKVITTLSLISLSLTNFLLLEDTETNPEYNMYVFSIQWGNTLCVYNKECQEKIKQIPKNIFTLHGLWPSFNDGKKVDECNKGTEIDVKIQEQTLYKDMITYWLSYTSSNQNFWNHEFNKHGYCYTERYNKKMEDFFSTSIGLFKNHSFAELAGKAFGDVKEAEKTYTYDQLIDAFKKVYSDLYFDIECKRTGGKNYISEVRFYFNLEWNPREHHAQTDCGKGPIYVTFEH